MTYPNIQERFHDYIQCEICKADKPDNEFHTVLIRKDGNDDTVRIYIICNDCYDKCCKDEEFEKHVTDYVFKNKLGRLVKGKVNK